MLQTSKNLSWQSKKQNSRYFKQENPTKNSSVCTLTSTWTEAPCAQMSSTFSSSSDSHYTRVLESEGYSLLAMTAGRPVGCICCSLEDDADAANPVASPFSPMQTIWRQSHGKTDVGEKKVVKVMLLQVSATERCRGIGSNMLRWRLAPCALWWWWCNEGTLNGVMQWK